VDSRTIDAQHRLWLPVLPMDLAALFRVIGDILGVNDAASSALFVECIKALKAQNADLSDRAAALEPWA
jgi:hypothetical protein